MNLRTAAIAVAAAGIAFGQTERLVQFELAAVGPRGEPVTDLDRGECQVTEDGKRETLALFHPVGSRGPAGTPTVGRREYSNRSGLTPHPTIILLDLLNERLLTWAVAGNQIVKAVERLESGEDLYFYILTNRGVVYPIHPLPRSEAELQDASGDWSKQIKVFFERAQKRFAGFRPAEDHDDIYRAQLTFKALGEFASRLAAIPGRKNLVWISHGIPQTVQVDGQPPFDLTPRTRDFSETLVQSNVAAYTVAQSGSDANSFSTSFETLRMVSELTGGRAYSSNSADLAIIESRADMRGSYVAGYYSRRSSGDGKYHKLRVTCARKGARVQTRQGYWDVRNPPQSEELEEAAVQAAASSPFDHSGIGLTVATSSIENPSGATRLKIRVDSSDLIGPSDPLTLAIISYEAGGGAQAYKFKADELKASQSQTAGGIEFTRDLMVGPSIVKLRIVVYDRGSKELGSVTISQRIQDR